MSSSSAIATAPKVELHLHLEGAIPLPTLWEVIQSHGGDPEVRSLADLERSFVFRDFAHFIDRWWWMTGFLRSEDDFTHLAKAVARGLADQNIVYAEASFSPSDFARHGLTPQQLAHAIRRGLEAVDATRVVLNVDLVRDVGIERGARTLDAVIEVKDESDIRGITIGGSEQMHPPQPYRDIYRRAAASGLRLTAHAGEAAGADSVRAALDVLGVERIGHGVRSVEDPELLARLVADQTPLEVCPTSNLRTGVAASWEDHPVGRLLDAGANVTISTDDPTLFHCTLTEELAQVGQRFGADAASLTFAAIEASWMTDEEKEALRRAVVTYWDRP